MSAVPVPHLMKFLVVSPVKTLQTWSLATVLSSHGTQAFTPPTLTPKATPAAQVRVLVPPPLPT